MEGYKLELYIHIYISLRFVWVASGQVCNDRYQHDRDLHSPVDHHLFSCLFRWVLSTHAQWWINRVHTTPALMAEDKKCFSHSCTFRSDWCPCGTQVRKRAPTRMVMMRLESGRRSLPRGPVAPVCMFISVLQERWSCLGKLPLAFQ